MRTLMEAQRATSAREGNTQTTIGTTWGSEPVPVMGKASRGALQQVLRAVRGALARAVARWMPAE